MHPSIHPSIHAYIHPSIHPSIHTYIEQAYGVVKDPVGSEVITINAMPSHTHGTPTGWQQFYGLRSVAGSGTSNPTGSANTYNNFPITAATGGGIENVQGDADGNMEPTSFMMVYLKL
jgi:hypothetical protein